MNRRDQERELLRLQAQLLRLKLTAEHLKLQQARREQDWLDSGIRTALYLADGLPPLNGRQRIWFAAGRLLWRAWCRCKRR